MEPIVVFEILTRNNEKICFECKLTKFNQLRFAVAYVLKEINSIEEKAIFKAL
ncbi:hypothetical protein B4U79_12502 [Dinothrombium tinctorium]|uniref:Uncharacterized protein n=1 Tax=Dinothrombium tinctorium TaxID=1965070 RepID=A0A3S3NVG0_9ACAR|nr:hypothetical protein B4U79_12502 [Dinothrombium tinctorium]